jgi:hypothetical protein
MFFTTAKEARIIPVMGALGKPLWNNNLLSRHAFMDKADYAHGLEFRHNSVTRQVIDAVPKGTILNIQYWNIEGARSRHGGHPETGSGTPHTGP